MNDDAAFTSACGNYVVGRLDTGHALHGSLVLLGELDFCLFGYNIEHNAGLVSGCCYDFGVAEPGEVED